MLCRISLSSLAILALKGAALVTAVSLANNPLFKRQDASTHGSEFKMYAYGTGIPGLEVFYGDGLAQLASGDVPSTIAKHMNVNFGPTTSNSGVWQVNQNGTATGSPPSTASLYINPTAGAFEPVGFADSTSHKLPDKGVASGFGFFGSSMVYTDSTTGKTGSQFWAKMTEKDRLWVVMWNTDGKVHENCVPVTLKDKAPVKQTKGP